MVAEWLDLLVPLGETAFDPILNKRIEKNKSVIYIGTEYYQPESLFTVVLSDHMYLQNFFKLSRVSERLVGISVPFQHLKNELLDIVYKTDRSFFRCFGEYLLKHLKHCTVGVLTFTVLPFLLIYDVLINKIFYALVNAEEWNGDNFFLGIITFIGDLISIPFILSSEIIRHFSSFMLSIICIACSFLTIPLGCLISSFLKYERPANYKHINDQAEILKGSKMIDLDGLLYRILYHQDAQKAFKVSYKEYYDQKKANISQDLLQKIMNGEMPFANLNSEQQKDLSEITAGYQASKSQDRLFKACYEQVRDLDDSIVKVL